MLSAPTRRMRMAGGQVLVEGLSSPSSGEAPGEGERVGYEGDDETLKGPLEKVLLSRGWVRGCPERKIGIGGPVGYTRRGTTTGGGGGKARRPLM